MDPCEKSQHLAQLVPGIDCEGLNKNISLFSVLTGATVGFVDSAGTLVAYSLNDDVVQQRDGKAERFYVEPFSNAVDIVEELSNSRELIVRPSEYGYNLAAYPVYFDGMFIGCIVLTHFRIKEDERNVPAGPHNVPIISTRRLNIMMRTLASAMNAGIFYQRHPGKPASTSLTDKQSADPAAGSPADTHFEINTEQAEVMDRLAQYEQELKLSEERFQSLVANLPAVVFRCELNPPWYMTYVSDAIIYLTGYAADDFKRGGKISYADIILPEDLSLVKETIMEAYRGRYRYEVEYRIRDINGEVHWVWERSIHYLDESSQIVYIDGIILDITEQRNSRDARESMERLYRGLVQNMNEAVVLLQLNYDDEGTLVDYVIRDANPAFGKILNLEPSEVINKSLMTVFPEWPTHPFIASDILQNQTFTDSYEMFFDSIQRFLFVSSFLMDQDMMTIIFTDVTRYRETQNQLMESLEEREVLIREVHHRVKNNLQTIIHLIEHQLMEATESKSRQAFSLLKGQAFTMALIYDQLNKSKHLSRIEMKPYLDELAYNLNQTLQPDAPVSISVMAPQVWLDVSLAMPCAMIVNELITNAFKYAFPPGTPQPYELEILLETKNSTVFLKVSDNGIGLLPGIDPEEQSGSGLKLVKLWATHQLAGTFELQSDHGVKVAISFPDKRKSKRKDT